MANEKIMPFMAANIPVIATDSNATKVAALRRRLHARGLYGSRISVHVGNPFQYPLPPFLASLVITETTDQFNAQDPEKMTRRVFLSLRPYGGIAVMLPRI